MLYMSKPATTNLDWRAYACRRHVRLPGFGSGDDTDGLICAPSHPLCLLSPTAMVWEAVHGIASGAVRGAESLHELEAMHHQLASSSLRFETVQVVLLARAHLVTMFRDDIVLIGAVANQLYCCELHWFTVKLMIYVADIVSSIVYNQCYVHPPDCRHVEPRQTPWPFYLGSDRYRQFF